MVLGPVLLPPWQRHRPLIMAGARHGFPARLRAPQRGAAFGLPRGLPFQQVLSFSIAYGLSSDLQQLTKIGLTPRRNPAASHNRQTVALPPPSAHLAIPFAQIIGHAAVEDTRRDDNLRVLEPHWSDETITTSRGRG